MKTDIRLPIALESSSPFDYVHDTYARSIWRKFCKHRLGLLALGVVVLFCLIGLYAPFLASSKAIFVVYQEKPYFPLFRYLFYHGFYTKNLDIFFNLLMFTLPLFFLAVRLAGKFSALAVIVLQMGCFSYFVYHTPSDPASDSLLNEQRYQIIKQEKPHLPNWAFDLDHMNDYAKLNLLVQYRTLKTQNDKLTKYFLKEGNWPKNVPLATLWEMEQEHQINDITAQRETLKRLKAQGLSDSSEYLQAQARLTYWLDRNTWLEQQSKELKYLLMPLIRPFHWEDDAGGSQELNQRVGFMDLTRINRKDLVAALIFGVRISLFVGIASVSLALLIGVPIGAYAGFYGGKTDIVVSRLLEIWEAMPTFFMLLMAVALLQNKSIFLVISIIGLFGWTGFSRYIRGEFFKQRNLPYVEACQALGFRNGHIMFSHILPNAIAPVLTLLPFAIMGAITSEAGLSFLGLGEEGSCSWGVLMDEGRNAFPAESYLLWPPAIALTILLIAIAIVGDTFRDALDPKMLHN